MVGIKDIAKKAGVSISTVSYALNGNPRISDKTRDRILKIANDMQYIPNMAGQNLRKKETKIIGVYLSSFAGTFYGDLVEGMKTKANSLGYDIIAFSGERARLYLPQGLIDGALILDFNYPTNELITYADRGFPVVVLDRKINHPNIKELLLDNKQGTIETMKYVVDANPNKVFIISGPKGNYDSNERMAAATDILKDTTIEYEILEGNYTQESGYKVAQKIGVDWESPIVIFALNDEMAIGIHNYYSEIKTDKIIGKNIGIIGFDGNIIGDYLSPPLASISYSETEWGKQSVQMLINLINEEEVKNSSFLTHFEPGGTFPIQKSN